MKTVITGAAGYIGAMVCADLLFAGYEVTGFDKCVYGGESLLGLAHHPGFSFVAGDVRDKAALAEAMRGAQAVVHLAAVVGEPACSLDEPAAMAINVDGARNVLEEARRAGVGRFVFISTCSNYGVSHPGSLATEETPLNPLSAYARSKVEGEGMTLADSGPMASTVLRLGTICGLSPRMRFDLLVSEMARAAVLGHPLEIYAPEAWRPFLHLQDACRAIRAVLEAPEDLVRGHVFNIIGENCQKSDLVAMVLRHFPKASVQVVDKAADKRDYRVNGTKVESALGFQVRHTVDEAFLQAARAVSARIFRNPLWPGHAAVPGEGAPVQF